MRETTEFVDLLAERRKDCDILWVSRPMDPLLPHKLPPEAKFNRSQIMQAVLNDPRVQLAMTSVAAAKGMNKVVLLKEAQAMIREMASKARLTTVRVIGIIITKVLKRIFASIFINESTLYRLKKEMQISQVQYVYAPTHRSYLDFVILSYILFSYDMALPNIASGMDFYQMNIIGELLRHTGAFYMRRSFANDLLYKNVFRAYVASIVSHSDRAIEFFIEGTRSRNMKSLVPKYGLLSIILESLLDGEVPDIYFIPISISYDRPLEELLFAYELLGVPKPKETTAGLLKSLSILSKPSAYSNVFFNIGEHISARDFLNVAQRKAKVLSPYTKLPSSSVDELAYCIIDSHKKNTVLTPFNIIALLFNQHVQMHGNNAYTLEHLVEDYVWCTNVLRSLSNAIIHTSINSSVDILTTGKSEIIQSLKAHDDLLVVDVSNAVRLKQRHQATKVQKDLRVKGHNLSADTMCIAVSAINLTIYVNPTLSFLVKPAIALVVIGTEGIKIDTAFDQYRLLRSLLSIEFAMQNITTDESAIKAEWDETIACLTRENCVCIQDATIIPGGNTKLFSLLHNLILPFVDAVHVSCLILFEWDEAVLGDITNHTFLVESQKRAEEAFLKGHSWGQHPYTLALDLYQSMWSHFLTLGIIVPNQEKKIYRADKVRLRVLQVQIQKLSSRRPPASYNNLSLLSMTQFSTNVQAKL